MAFLKKSDHTVHQLGRLALVRGIDAGSIPPMDPVVAEEVEAIIRNWTPPDDWRINPKQPRKPLEL